MSSILCCVIGRPPWQRVSRGRWGEMVGKDNFAEKQLSVGALRLSSGNGVCDLGTGVLIHNSLVLTSHLNLSSKESAENGEFVLTDGYLEPNSYSDPTPSERSFRVLTRKLLPARCFLTNPSLGVTIVGCEPVSFEVPLDIEIAKVPREILSVGHRIYVLGHTQHDVKRRRLIKFGEGRISSENEQAIEFYSLDGKVWAPGSAGFDEQGKFAFVVGDSKSPSGAKWGMFSLQEIIQFEKDSGPKQPGILVHFVREWIRTVWDWGFAELIKESPSLVSTALPGSATKELSKDPIRPIDSVPNTLQELRSAYEGPKGEIVDVHMESIPREDLISRKDCAAVDSSVASLASPMRACTSSDTSAHVDHSRFSSNLGGIADLAATEWERLVEPNRALEEEFSTAIDGDNCNITHNDFITRIVKVRYFNKDIFSPDQMPMTDNPKPDPNGGSWFDWGKKTPKSPPLSPKLAAKVASGDPGPVELRLQFLNDAERTIPERKATDLIKKWETSRAARLQPTCCPLSPKDPAKAAYGDPLEVRPAFLKNAQRTIPECKDPDPIKNRETSRDSGLQPLRPEIFTSIPERDTSKWTVLRVDAPSGEAPSGSHPGSAPLSSPELSSPVSHFKKPFKPTLDQVDSPREFAFGQIHRSTISPRSPSRAKTVPWKPPGSHGSGDPGSPPVGFPRQGAPRLFRGLRKRLYDLTESAEARAVRKNPILAPLPDVNNSSLQGSARGLYHDENLNSYHIPREKEQPGKPRWSAHSRVQKKDDNKKIAALPPRIVKPGEFPAKLFSSHLSSPAQLWKGTTAGSRKGKKAEIAETQKSQADTSTPNICNIGSPQSTRGLRDICTTTTGCSRMLTNRLISKHKEKDRPKLRVKRFLVSSTSWVPNLPAVRNKKYEQQSSSKRKGKAASSEHAQKGLEPLEPLASKIHAQTNSESDEQQQISCCKHGPKATVVSSASGSARVLAESIEKITTPTKKCRPIRLDEEILNEIDRLQAVLRSPRDKSIPRECQGRSPSPEQTVGDSRQEVDSRMICSGLVEITEPKSEQDIRFTCCQYWEKIITGRRDTLLESMKALFWPQPNAAARAEQHTLKVQPNAAARAEQHTLKVQPNAAARAEHHIPKVQANAAGRAGKHTPKAQSNAAAREEQQTLKVQLNATAARAEQRTPKSQSSAIPRAEQRTPKLSCSPAREGMDEEHRSLWRKTPLQQNINKAFVFTSPAQSPERHKEAKLWDKTCYGDVWNDPLKIQPQGKQSHQISKPDSQTAGQQQSKVVTGESGIRRLKDATVYQMSSKIAPWMQSVELECVPTMRDTERTAWDGTCWCDVWHDPLKTQPEGKQTHQTSKPDSRIIAREQQSKVVTGEGGSSFGIRPVYFSASPSNATAPNSRLDWEMTSSPRKYLSKATAVPETGQPTMSSRQRRPRSPVTRVDGRLDTNRVIRECSGKTLISSVDVQLEALIFDTENEDSAPILKRSGVPELAVAKQKLHNWLHKCLVHPETVPYYQEKAGVPELAFAKPKLQKCLAHPDKAAYNPEKSSFGIGSKLNAPSLAKSPERRARLGTTTNHPSGGKRERLGKMTFTAEIGTGVVSSEDGLYISKIGPIVRCEGRAQAATAVQQGKWMPQWRP